jgi:hypothetical protein
LALAVPLSRFTSQVGGGSAFYVRHHYITPFMKYIIKIEDKEFSVADVRHVKFEFGQDKIAHLNIVLANKDALHFESPLSDSQRVSMFWAVKTEIINALTAMAEKRLVLE